MPVLHDVVASGSGNTSSTTITIAFTVGTNNNRYLVVGLSETDAAGTSKWVSSMTYAGIAMTKLGEFSSDAARHCSLWGLVAPATGANNLIMTRPSGGDDYYVYGIQSKYGVNQTAPVGTCVTATGTGVSSSLGVGSNPGDLVVDVLLTINGTTRNPGGSQTERWDIGPIGYSLTGNGSDCTAPAGTSTTMTWTWTNSVFWIQVGVALHPMPAGQSVMWWFFERWQDFMRDLRQGLVPPDVLRQRYDDLMTI